MFEATNAIAYLIFHGLSQFGLGMFTLIAVISVPLLLAVMGKELFESMAEHVSAKTWLRAIRLASVAYARYSTPVMTVIAAVGMAVQYPVHAISVLSLMAFGAVIFSCFHEVGASVDWGYGTLSSTEVPSSSVPVLKLAPAPAVKEDRTIFTPDLSWGYAAMLKAGDPIGTLIAEVSSVSADIDAARAMAERIASGRTRSGDSVLAVRRSVHLSGSAAKQLSLLVPEATMTEVDLGETLPHQLRALAMIAKVTNAKTLELVSSTPESPLSQAWANA